MTNTPTWYAQSKYEQAYENYRNEDENYRSSVTQYLVFTATVVLATTQGKEATSLVGIIGFLLSVVTVLYLNRVRRYSRGWLNIKDAAIGELLSNQERNNLSQPAKESLMLRVFSFIPGYMLHLAIPLAGAVLFAFMAFRGSNFWAS